MNEGEAQWYTEWQSQTHAVYFDGRTALGNRNLLRNYEGFNDVRLLNERIPSGAQLSLLEVGCATGEFYRYLRVKHPGVHYYGIDISEPAVARAQAKYPEGAFFVTEPSVEIGAALRAVGLPGHHEIVYAKDVIQHQTKSLEFLSELIAVASEAVIIRCRTRDVGTTEWDPNRSCQYHYGGWLPYIVINLQELLEHILREARGCEVVVYRNHMILGGLHHRFVPKELYLETTGTAETAVGIFTSTSSPGNVLLEDRLDGNPRYPWSYVLPHAVNQAWKTLCSLRAGHSRAAAKAAAACR